MGRRLVGFEFVPLYRRRLWLIRFCYFLFILLFRSLGCICSFFLSGGGNIL